jgi:hypothetical protein
MGLTLSEARLKFARTTVKVEEGAEDPLAIPVPEKPVVRTPKKSEGASSDEGLVAAVRAGKAGGQETLPGVVSPSAVKKTHAMEVKSRRFSQRETDGAEDFELLFGKYRGRRLSELVMEAEGKSYLKWLLAWDDLPPDIRAAATYWLDR